MAKNLRRILGACLLAVATTSGSPAFAEKALGDLWSSAPPGFETVVPDADGAPAGDQQNEKRPEVRPHVSAPASVLAAAAKVHWTPALVERLVAEMPKVETHLHLDGAVYPETVKKLADERDYKPLENKSVDDVAKLTVVSKPRDSLKEMLDAFGIIYPLLKDAKAVEEIAYALARRAGKQNVRYMEVRFAPSLQATPEFTPEQVLQAALRGLARGEADFGVRSNVIICLIRGIPFVGGKDNDAMLDLAIRYAGKGVVAIDLAGNEAAQPLSAYADYYVKAKKAGLHLTAHAGEVPGSPDIQTALDLGVERLGHALQLQGRPDQLEQVVARQITIEVNLTSNIRTGGIPDYQHHPVAEWYRHGALLELSTDDPGVFGIDLDGEYRALAGPIGFAPADVINVSFQGLEGLFLPDADKAALKAQFASDFDSLLRGLSVQRP